MISYIVALTSVNLDEPAQPPFTIETPNGVHRIFKRLAKALTRMRVFAGGQNRWLVAHTRLFEISCRGSYTTYQWSGKF